MATFQDCSEYTYHPSEQPMLNVGWLGAEVDFPRGPVSSEVVDALLVLAADQKNVMRGVHHCEFCGEESPIRLPVGGPGGWVSLGGGEVHVRSGDGQIFAAPSLVIHYIMEHEYIPPRRFQEAVLETAGGMERSGKDEPRK
jgi:hypothetical protein